MLGCRSSDGGGQLLLTGSDVLSGVPDWHGVLLLLLLRISTAWAGVLEVGLALAELLADDDTALAVGDAAADGAACGDVGVLTGDGDDGAASMGVGLLGTGVGAAAADFFFFLRRLRLFLRLAEVVVMAAAAASAACCGVELLAVVAA